MRLLRRTNITPAHIGNAAIENTLYENSLLRLRSHARNRSVVTRLDRHIFGVTLKGRSPKGDVILMGRSGPRNHLGSRRRSVDGDEGIDFVHCRICGDHRRVISGRHLSKHDTDRKTYMQEYDLSPDELIAKAFRIIQSSHPGYYPHTKKGWIAAMQKVYENDGNIFANICNTISRSYTAKAFGFLVAGTRRCRRRVLIPTRCVCRGHGTGKRSSRSCRTCEIEIYPFMPTTC
jgi:hypothetical protein